MPNFADKKIVFLGTGAIGGSAGAWIASQHENTFLLSRGKTAEVLRANGMTTYRGDRPEQKATVKVKVIEDLEEVPDADVVLISVKLYDLDHVAQMVKEKLGDRPIIVGMQNGVENQKILPRYFSRVIYCLITYNAWVEAPGLIGYQRKGPLTLGTPDNLLQEEMQTLAALFSPVVETVVTQRLQDAAHCKLIINLGNSITTLIRRDFRDGNETGLFQKILAGTVYEGVRVVRAAGYRQERLKGTPSWSLLWAAAKLPQFMTQGSFRSNLKQFVLSSMGQDVLQRKSAETELEYLNGYLLSLAGRFKIDVPYNRVIYRLCKENFALPEFAPLDVSRVWEEIRREIG